ncbi:uncharacterized protein LOC107367948 [Tetranychus urticae]|uniref:Male-enhanced antigen 1 n=1 Tax=Tetranychus urticae TaxID=32264 RepID=T1KWJ4_TETUR|nr:uncharacterized protein LOC107367948 [Tetranychus urticae]
MAPDTGPNESSNQNDEYLSGAPPYNFPDPSSDEDDDEADYVGNDDDSDADENMGYQLLNQETEDRDCNCPPVNQQDNATSECQQFPSIHDTSNNSSMFPVDSLLLPVPKDEMLQELESAARPDIELDQDKIEQIKKAMSGFNLPSSSIPGWASVVSEDQLADFIHCKTKSS